MRLLLLAITSILTLSGCYLGERIWWSPKGDRAVVLIDHSLRVMNADGTLGAAISQTNTEDDALFSYVSWLPDSSGFVFRRKLQIKHWDEVAKLIPPAEIVSIDRYMPAILPLLEANKTTDIIDHIVEKLPEDHLATLVAAFQRAYEQSPDKIETLLSASERGKKMLEDIKKSPSVFTVNQLCLHKFDSPIQTLASSIIADMIAPKCSPKHPAVSYLQFDPKSDSVSIQVRSLTSGTSLEAAQNASLAFDWSPDGRSIIFSSPVDGKDGKLHSIQRRTVLQADGTLMKPADEKLPDGSTQNIKGPDRLDSAESLATALMLEIPTLRSLPDGRILFASQPMTLPHKKTDAELDSRFFIVSADGSELTELKTEPGALPAELSYFTVSPDGKQAAIAESQTNAIAIVDLTTGDTSIISEAAKGFKSTTIPSWKSNTELTFVGIQDSKPQLMLWSKTSGSKPLSTTWPAASLKEWMGVPSPESK